MKRTNAFCFVCLMVFMSLGFMMNTVVQAQIGNIDPTDKWAWGTNVGWINFRPVNGGVTVHGDHLEGYAWGENIGWIRLGTYESGGAHTYANTSNTDYGVNRDLSGNLSGYAWGTNVGWINFAPTNGGVTIDPLTGSFDGYAWGENNGWIHFKNASPAYNVATLSVLDLIVTVDTEMHEDNSSAGNMKVTDGDGDGVVGPGDVLLCEIVIENIGIDDITGVTYSGHYDNTTLVVGSVTTTQGVVSIGNNPGDVSVEVNVGTVPEGVTVVITYQVVIDDPLPPGVTVITHQGICGTNELGDIMAEDIHTADGVTRIFIGDPIVSVFISPDVVIDKPNSQFQVCIEVDSATAQMAIYSVYALITFDSTILDSVKVPTFEGTLPDSSGWDLKWHYYPGTPDSLELFLIGGGGDGLTGKGPIVCWEFRVSDLAMPGDTSAIRFSKFWFNEGRPMSETENGFFMVNRPPVLTWNGEVAPDTIDAIVLQESHDFSALIDAHDWDIDSNHPQGDSIYLWAQSDPITDPCPWMDGAIFDSLQGPPALPYIVGPVIGPGSGVEALFEFHPPKHGDCDDFWVDFIAMSTFETGQPLFDTLTVHFLVEDCAYQFAWCQPPPNWFDPGGNSPIDTFSVFACQRIEIPVGMHFDYSYLLGDPIWAISLDLEYDPLLEVFEVGNEGLITGDLGAMRYNNTEPGKLSVTMAFNSPLQWPPYPQPPDPLYPPFGFEVCPWYNLLYVGFKIPEDVPAFTHLNLKMVSGSVMVNEGVYNSCVGEESWLEVGTFAISGEIYYSDSGLPVPGVSIMKGQECFVDGVLETVTDPTGHYESNPVPGCSDFCLWPHMDNTITVEQQIVTSYDATLILRALCGAVTLSHNDSLAADVTGDGTVSAFDASVLLKWVVSGYAGHELIPAHNIGDWIFESYLACFFGPGSGCGCFTNLQMFVLYCWEGVITGDVSQNWPGPTAKVVAGDIEAKIVGNTLTVDLSEVSAVDMEITSQADMKVADVAANGIVEWAADAGTIRLAAASETNLGQVTVTFERIVPTELEITARADEGAPMSTVVKVVPMPTEFSLAQNYPNPFNPLTSIEYALPEAARVIVEVYNVLGQMVDVLVDGDQEAGYHKVTWDATDMASGVYFYRIEANTFRASKRLVLMK